MLTYDRIKMLCKQKGVTVTGTEKELNFARGSLCKVETNKPSMEKVKKLAEFFEVSVEYLISDNDEEKQTELTSKDERDIAKDMDNLLKKLRNKENGPVSYEGENIPEEDIDLLAGQIELMLRRLKPINKEKYNPNKNKK